jgi:hypothetical protein
MLVTADTPMYVAGEPPVQPAVQIVAERLHERSWPINARTRYRAELISGRTVFFYVGGRKRLAQHLVASATIAAATPGSAFPQSLCKPYRLRQPAVTLQLDNIREFDPIDIHGLLGVLSFTAGAGGHWSFALQGGCVPLLSKDMAAIEAAILSWLADDGLATLRPGFPTSESFSHPDRSGLKIRRGQPRKSSILFSGTIVKTIVLSEFLA